MPAVGSSRNTTRGLPTSAHASERRWAWPPDNRRTGVPTVSRQPDELEHRLRRFRGPVVGSEQPQQLERAQARVEPTRLQHHADLRAEVLAVAHRVEAEDAHRARVGSAVALEDLDRRGLAGAVRSEQPEDLARADTEVERIDRARRSVRLAESGDRDRGLGGAQHSGVPPRDVRGELVEPDSGRRRERRSLERGAGFADQPLDRGLYLFERPRSHEQRLQRGNIGVGEVGRAHLPRAARDRRWMRGRWRSR